MKWLLVVLSAALAGAGLASAASAENSIAECGSELNVDECLRKTLLLDGAVSLHVPGLEAARESALLSVAACSDGTEVMLPDGTARRSIGTQTIVGVAKPLEASCTGLSDATAAMRALVDAASMRLFSALQPLQHGAAALLSESGGAYDSLASVARERSLEHFHIYSGFGGEAGVATADADATAAAAAAAAAVPLHTDAGLLIALVPALHAHLLGTVATQAAPADDGFYVQRWDGSRVRIARSSERSSVVFLVGEGWSTWLNARLSVPLRPAPHAMVMPRMGPHQVRVWYGRMFLPPADAVQHTHGTPFRVWQQFHAAQPVNMLASSTPALKLSAVAVAADHLSNASLPVGCGGGRRFGERSGSRLLTHTADTNGCVADQIFCWHQCVDVSSLPCGDHAVCWRHEDESIWQPEDAHCASCEARCLEPPSPPATSPPASSPYAPHEDPFCTGAGTDMHMSGFAFYPTDCLILLFRGWKLDSAASFALGVLGTLFLGIATEGMTFLRRTKIQTLPWQSARPRAFRATLGLAFSVQVTFGYLLMLAAMTYQGEVFIAVIAGLGIGHVLFNASQPVGEQTDACCVDAVPKDEGSKKSGGAGGNGPPARIGPMSDA